MAHHGTCKAVMAASFSVMTQCSRSFSSAPTPPIDALLDVLLPNPILKKKKNTRAGGIVSAPVSACVG